MTSMTQPTSFTPDDKTAKIRLHGLFNLHGVGDEGLDVATCRKVLDLVAATTDAQWQIAAASRLNLYRKDAEWFAQAADYVAQDDSKQTLERFVSELGENFLGKIPPVHPVLDLALHDLAQESYGRQTVIFQSFVMEFLAAKAWESYSPHAGSTGPALKN